MVKHLFKKLHFKFQDIICYLIYDREWLWLEFIISLLCEIEMQFPLIFDKEFKYSLNTADSRRISPPPEEKETFAEREIPKNTMYCEDCIFRNYSKIATFFYGHQSCGYCYYLSKGDFSFVRPTDILWDGCKCCGIGEEMYDEEHD